MKIRDFLTIVLFILLTVMEAFFFLEPAGASVAKISRLSGDVILQSGGNVVKVTAPGVTLNDGDRIQTKQGEVDLVFNDGAVMKINAFSNAMIQERTEEGGFWVFKTRQEARRITCLVGKLFFQSGVSGKKNYLQTPTAVAGVRGSQADLGYDVINSYLHIYEGDAAVIGTVIRGLFQNPGISAAQKSIVYQSLATAYVKTGQAAASGRGVDAAQAQVAAFEVGKQVAQVLQANPDTAVKNNAALIGQVSEANISAATAKVSVEQIKEDKAGAERAAAEARQKGDTEKAAVATAAAQKAEQDRIAAEKQVAAANASALQAAAAAAAGDLTRAQKAAEDAAQAAARAKALAEESRKLIQDVAPTTTTTTTTSVETTAATTVAPEVTTTAITTTSEPTTSSTSILTSVPSTTTSSTTTVKPLSP